MKLAFELEIPDGAIDKSTENELLRSVKEQTVLKLYSEQRITTGEAAAMLGLTRVELFDFLHRSGIGFLVDLDEEDFAQLRRARDALASQNSR